MKLKNEVVIDAQGEAVWSAFEDADTRPEWQSGLTARRQISGKPNDIGSVVELTFDEGGSSRSVIETITERRRPNFLAATYESRHRTLLTVNTFESIGGEQTRWSVWSNVRFRGIASITSLFTAKRVRQQLEDDMQRFKLLVETREASTPS
ncbi:MAG: SRPBCC family protein [Pseudomonadota bacterium]